MRNMFLIVVVILLIQPLSSCKKESIPVLSTTEVSNITVNSAVCGGIITDEGSGTVIAKGVCWSVNNNPTTSDSKTNEGNGLSQFESNINGLTAGLTYHVRAYATNSVGTAYGTDRSFLTLGQVPGAVTNAATEITYSGVTINGTVNANYLISTVTFEIGTTAVYGRSIDAIPGTVAGNSPTNVSAILTDLTPGIVYHFRVKVVNSLGTNYGNDLSFTTLNAIPTVSTSVVTNITTSGAESGGNITNEGIGPILAHGVCWNTNSKPTIDNNKTIDGTGSGSFASIITGLDDGKSYYIRAYASNSAGTSYGNEISFTTDANPVCGQTIMKSITLTEDMLCSSDMPAVVIGASNVVFDLGGHTISGSTPGVGVFAQSVENIIIRNGKIEGFERGTFMFGVRNVILENLTVINNDIADPNHFVFGIVVDSCQDVVVRNSQFEFISAPHKEAIEIYNSNILVENIEVQGGGAGVNFSFNQICDPQKYPNIGEVINSHFSDICIAGIEIACTSSVRISGNDISTTSGVGCGIQTDAPFSGAVTGLLIENNNIHNTMNGIEFRGANNSIVTKNIIKDNLYFGIWVRQSLGCLAPTPGWDCFYSSNNTISDNEVLGNGTDLYQEAQCVGNVWERNIFETSQGIIFP